MYFKRVQSTQYSLVGKTTNVAKGFVQTTSNFLPIPNGLPVAPSGSSVLGFTLKLSRLRMPKSRPFVAPFENREESQEIIFKSLKINSMYLPIRPPPPYSGLLRSTYDSERPTFRSDSIEVSNRIIWKISQQNVWEFIQNFEFWSILHNFWEEIDNYTTLRSQESSLYTYTTTCSSIFNSLLVLR
jgi:hypothetical protein